MNKFRGRLTLAGLLLLLAFLWMPRRTPPPALSLPPAADALVSYHLAVQSAADGLTRLKSRQDFDSARQKIDDEVDKVVVARQRLSEVTAKDKLKATMEHASAIEQSNSALRQLVEWQRTNPVILGEHWDQYAAKLGTADVIRQ